VVSDNARSQQKQQQQQQLMLQLGLILFAGARNVVNELSWPLIAKSDFAIVAVKYDV